MALLIGRERPKERRRREESGRMEQHTELGTAGEC